MKTKNNSYLEIQINGTTIGFATNVFHYYSYTTSIISTEIIPYPAITTIQGINLNPNWPTYLESALTNNGQDIVQTEQLLKIIILNFKNYNVKIFSRREAYNLEVKVKGESKKAFLVYEKYFVPNFKQVQIFPSNEIIRFPIEKEDHEIQDEVVAYFIEK